MVQLKAIPKMLSMIGSVIRGIGRQDLERIKAITRKAFPGVAQISTEQLGEWMSKPDLSLLLIDVRAPHEFEISQLRGAVNLTTSDAVAKAIRERKPSTCVLYCSVGFRSSRLADQLTREGIAGVMNLDGSIFQWANEGRPLYRDATPVHQVHPYSKRWAGLLRPEVAARI